MQKNDVTSPSETEIVQQLNALRASSQQARLRALLPYIEELTRLGVLQSRILEVLAGAGIVLKPASLRQSLYRWRLRQRDARSQLHPTPTIRPEQPAPRHPVSLPSPNQAGPNGIQSKADLKRLRDSSDHIDLNELADYGRNK